MAITRTLLTSGGIETDEQRQAFARFYSQLLRERSGKPNPIICQLSQSQGEKPETIDRDKQLFTAEGCRFTALTTFKSTQPFTKTIAEADGFYIVGGNTINMLAIWQARGLVPLLRAAYEQGKPIAGYSAGAMCWFENFLTSDIAAPDEYRRMAGLGWLPGSFAPHYRKTKPGYDWRAPIYERMIASGDLNDGHGCDDGVFGLYENETLTGFHSVVPDGRAYKIQRQGAAAVMEIIVPQLNQYPDCYKP